jgi:hypothetical protein
MLNYVIGIEHVELYAHPSPLLVEIEPSPKSISVELKGRKEICDLKLLQFLATVHTTKITFSSLSLSFCQS